MTRALPWLVALLLFGIIGGPVLLRPGEQLFHRDSARFDYPVRKVIASRLARGELPLWDPWAEAGTSLLGQLTPAVLHPAAVLYVALPFDLAFKLHHLLMLPLAALGAFLLARRLGAPGPAAAAAGAICGGSGFIVSMAASNLPYAVGAATLPWALWAFARFLEERTPLRLLCAAALLALCTFAGEPLSMLVGGLLGLAGAGLAHRLRGLLCAALWGALSLALSLPAFLPAVLRVPASTRAHGLAAAERERFETHPLRLFGLVVPRAFDDTQELIPVERRAEATPLEEYFTTGGESYAFADSILLGAPALLFAFGALWAGRRGRALLLGAVLLTLMATGGALGVRDAVARVLPPLAFFRFPEKFLAHASLCFALAAALGIDALRARRPVALVSALLAVLALAGFLAAPSLLETFVAAGATHQRAAALSLVRLLRFGLPVTAALSLLTLLSTLVPRVPAAATALCLAGVLFVPRPYTAPLPLFSSGERLAAMLLRRSHGEPFRVFSPERALYGSGRDRRTAQLAGSAASLLPHLDSLVGVETAASYSAVTDARYALLEGAAPAAFLRLLDVRYVVALPSDARRGETLLPAPYGLRVREVSPLPRAHVGGVRAVPDEAAAIAALQDLGHLRDAVEIGGAPLLPATGAAQLVRVSPEVLDVRVSADAPAMLSVGEHFDPGWSATVDGAPAPVSEVDLALLGVRVPQGAHRVLLQFRPRGLVPGALVALGALLATLGAARAARTRRVAG